MTFSRDCKGLFYVKDIFVIAVENECKEVLFYCEKNFEGEPSIHAIDLSRGKVINKFTFSTSDERSITPEYSQPLTYLYEPNAAILKAGAFKMVGTRYMVKKLHPHTHLYTSEMLDRNFPGRIFRIIAHVKPYSKTLRDYFPQGKANVTTRNYPMTVKELEIKQIKGWWRLLFDGFPVLKKVFGVAEKIS